MCLEKRRNLKSFSFCRLDFKNWAAPYWAALLLLGF